MRRPWWSREGCSEQVGADGHAILRAPQEQSWRSVLYVSSEALGSEAAAVPEVRSGVKLTKQDQRPAATAAAAAEEGAPGPGVI